MGGGVQAARLQKIPPAAAVSRGIVGPGRNGITRKEGDHVVVHDVPESGYRGIHRRVAGNAGRIGQNLLAPDKPRVLAEVDHLLEEATKDVETEALPDAAEAGGIGKRLVQVVAEIPPHTQAIHGQGEELTL